MRFMAEKRMLSSWASALRASSHLVITPISGPRYQERSEQSRSSPCTGAIFGRSLIVLSVLCRI